MSKQDVDNYLASLDEPKRSTLETLRQTILDIVPEAEQCISYGAPAFRLHGKVVAGFAAFKNHLSYLPHSGSVFPELGDEISNYKTSSGALQFPVDRPLPKSLVKRLIAIRKRQALGTRPVDEGADAQANAAGMPARPPARGTDLVPTYRQGFDRSAGSARVAVGSTTNPVRLD